MRLSTRPARLGVTLQLRFSVPHHRNPLHHAVMTSPWADTGDGELLERLSVVSGAMMFIVNLTPKTLWVSDRLVETTGYSFEDFAFERFENPFIPVDDLPPLIAALTKFLGSDDTVSEPVSNRFIDRWGGTLHVHSRITKVLWKGEQALLYTTFEDAPESDGAVELQQHYRSLVEAADDSIVRLTADLCVQYSNRCFQDLLGLPPIELHTMAFPDLVLPPHREAIRAALQGTDDRVEVRVPVTGASGGEVWIEGTFVRTPRGPDAGSLQAILRDTTERRRLDARVQQADKQETLSRLAGGIAHDLNNILTGIMGSAALAEDELTRGESASESLANIHTAAVRAGELSSSMLAYAGEGSTKRAPIDLTRLVEEMRPLLTTAVSKNVRLELRLPEERLTIVADDTQLRQVLMNLIINAADASPDGAKVTVDLSHSPRLPEPPLGSQLFGEVPRGGPVAVVRVIDRGVGMAPDLVRRIFDPFFSTKGTGRGLGLASALGIMTRHGGVICVGSEVGRGTAMELWLPLPDVTLPEARPTRVPDTTPIGGTALVVDDEPMIRRLVGRTLERLGYTVLYANCGERALERMDAHGPSIRLVVLDQTMPGMGGAEVLARLRVDYPALPVLCISGYTPDLDANPLDPHTAFLSKPFTTQQLGEMVGRTRRWNARVDHG